MTPSITLTEITKAMPSVTSETNFVISPGSINLIVGPNGSGKTTLLDVIAGHVDSGPEMAVHRVEHIVPTDVAYLPQTLHSIADLTLADLHRLAGAAPEPRTDMRRFLGALSGGQRQLLLFRLMASQNRTIFVYDEPFRHIDEQGVKMVLNRLSQQLAEGRLIVMGANEDALAAIESLPTRVAVRLSGRHHVSPRRRES